jgi:hypothetical protein
MKRIIQFAAITIITIFAASSGIFAEDDNLFGDNTIVDSTVQPAAAPSDDNLFSDNAVDTAPEQNLPKTDLAHGTLFQTGSIKIGGQFDMSLTSFTQFNKDTSFEKSVKNTVLSPLADALFTIDARPSENLRMYFKGGIHFPYITEKNATVGELADNTQEMLDNLFYVKELFTDFGIGDTAYFRFGKQTITWGTGYFFSPSSNIVNLSTIDPEDTDEQVEGPLALRTQIVFRGSQNCIWVYMIPDSSLFTYPTSNTSSTTAYTMASDTAFAAKGDIVLGGWELGIGGFYKYAHAPKGVLTASGTLFSKINTFAECVWSYGTDTGWSNSESWDNKNSVWQTTAGCTYTWKEPQITFAGQYYYDGNDEDSWDKTMHGHNVAGLISFAKVFTTDLTASVYGNVNFGVDTLTAFAMLYYSPINEIKLGAGPYAVWSSFDSSPNIAVKLSATLGGGKF